MLPHDCLDKIVRPALAQVNLSSPEAEVELLAIGLQESDLVFTRQLDGGPARGYWMDEIEGVADVFRHSHSAERMHAFCRVQGIEPTADAVFAALEDNPILACGVARLKLATNPLPLTLDPDAMWALYVAVWRPGKPRPLDWAGNFNAALKAVTGESP